MTRAIFIFSTRRSAGRAGNLLRAVHADGSFARLAVALVVLAFLSGCKHGAASTDLTRVAGGRGVEGRQSSPTEIQALVMAFADKYAARAADGFDRVHDHATTIAVRLYAKEAKASAGWGVLTIATEVNPVAAMLDMVTMVRLKRKSFEDHGASLLPDEPAQLIRAMHQQSEKEVWELAGRFLTGQQMDQLRDVIDGWYERNSELRTVAHLKLLDFASFRRESALSDRAAPANVLSLLHLNPLASMDPVQREISESRLFAERTLFFVKRIPTLAYWQFQLATVDLFSTPEMQRLFDQTQTISASIDRFATSSDQFIEVCNRFSASAERFTATWEQMPGNTERIVGSAIEDFKKVVEAERTAAIEQSTAAIDAQRKALMKDMDAVEGSARSVIADVNKTLIQTQTTASAVSASAKDTVDSAHLSAQVVVDQIYRRLLTLLVVAMFGVPVSMILYRLLSRRLFGVPAGTESGLTMRSADPNERSD